MSPRDWKLRQLREASGVEVVEVIDPTRPYPIAVLDGWFEIELHPVCDYDGFTGAHQMSAYEADRLDGFLRWKRGRRA